MHDSIYDATDRWCEGSVCAVSCPHVAEARICGGNVQSCKSSCDVYLVLDETFAV